MRKRLLIRSLPEMLYRCGYILLSILLFGLILSACQSNSIPSPEPTVEVTTQTVAMYPSPTPACTQLQPGMSVTVHPLINHQMIIQLKGFKPGEKVDVTGNTQYGGNGRGFEIFDLKIEPDGSAYDREGSTADTGAALNHWHFQVTYSGGVACADINTVP
jgi:hypothetical protein